MLLKTSFVVAFAAILSGCVNHPVDCSVGFAWDDCLPGTAGYANLHRNDARKAAMQASFDAQDDARCKSYGLKFGSSTYAECRQRMLSIRSNASMQKDAAAIAILGSNMQRQQNQVYTPTTNRPVNCTSSKIGTIINTSCY